jgi:hypothetical protein
MLDMKVLIWYNRIDAKKIKIMLDMGATIWYNRIDALFTQQKKIKK